MTSCYDYALKYLSRYPKTSYELAEKLKQKGYDHQDIQDTIVKLQTIGFLDDVLYAEMYMRSEVARKGKPLFLIQRKLYQKGIGKDILDDIIQGIEEELTQGQQKKIRKEIIKHQEKGLEKFSIIKKLQTRGYAYRDVQAVYADI